MGTFFYKPFNDKSVPNLHIYDNITSTVWFLGDTKVVDSFSTEPICPINALCKRGGTIVHLGYEIGCHQKLKSFDYKVVSDGETTELIVSAIATSKAIPGQPVCLALKFETKKLYLYEVYGDVVVTNLGTN